MKIKNTLPKLMAILFVIIALASCEEDVNSLGSNIIGDQILNSTLNDSLSVIAYSKKLQKVQTNNLPVYQIGIYNDPVYGKTTANLISQLTLNAPSPDFGDNAEMESAFLYIPFFNKATVEGEDTTYTLDSIFGSAPVNITIYESKYFLRDIDPNSSTGEVQRYYSDQASTFENFLGEELVTLENFIPSSSAQVVNDSVSLAPGIRVELPKEFFQEKIIDMEGSPELLNNNNFKNYFRGLYFKVDSAAEDGTLFFLNLNEGRISLEYSYDDSSSTTGERINNSLLLAFGGVNVNVFNNTLPQGVETAITNSNATTGDENLYIRGNDGVISIIKLFGDDIDGNGVPEELEYLRQQKWIINEANLFFYVDKNKVTGGEKEPERVFIFDPKNEDLLTDYIFDITANDPDILEAVGIHLGRLKRGSDGNGDYYKISITNHISNLINKDSTNVSLGLTVSQNVLLAGFQKVKNDLAPNIKGVPSSSVVSPEGTVLYGNNTTNEDKRLKLQIYYTKPN